MGDIQDLRKALDIIQNQIASKEREVQQLSTEHTRASNDLNNMKTVAQGLLGLLGDKKPPESTPLLPKLEKAKNLSEAIRTALREPRTTGEVIKWVHANFSPDAHRHSIRSTLSLMKTAKKLTRNELGQWAVVEGKPHDKH